jgi:hypothetical protein
MSLLAILFGRSPQAAPRLLTAATVILSADHRNQETGEVHAHTWKITAWVGQEKWSGRIENAISLQRSMENWRERHSGKCLPDTIAWGENIAADVAGWLSQDIGRDEYCPMYDVRAVLVERDEEGLSAAWLS